MSHPLLDRLAEIRRRVRHLLVLHGVGWVIAGTVAATAVVCFGDWLLRWKDPGVRLIFGLGLLGLLGWLTYRFLWLPLRVPLSDVELALRVESRFPGLKDSLASTINFLRDNRSPELGSPDLQQLVIEQTRQQVERLNLRDVIDPERVKRVVFAAVGVCLMTAVLVAVNQKETAIALKRLVFPFSGPTWPRQTNLRLLTQDLQPLELEPAEPYRLARGDTLRFYVENRTGKLPTRVQLELRTPRGSISSEVLRANTVRDSKGRPRDVAVGQLLSQKGPVEFRVVGGDDDTMPFFKVLVLPPPAVETLQVSLTPPAYLHRDLVQLPPGAGHVEGVLGTQVHVQARLNKPVKSAMLRIKDQQRMPVQLDVSRRELTAQFTIQETGVYSYWFDLKDMEGFENSDPTRYEIRGIQDQIPDVFIEVPAGDQQVTPSAQVPLKIVAKDDLGLKSVQLHFTVQELLQSAEPIKYSRHIVLFEGTDRPQHQVLEHVWNLAELSLSPGTRITFYAEAADDCDLVPQHVGRSMLRTLTIVSREAKLQELAERQTHLLEQLERTAKLQEQTHEHVAELQLQWNKAHKFRTEDLDMLQRVELNQRQITAQLAGPLDGVEKKSHDLLHEFRDNQLDESPTQRRIEQLSRTLGRLSQERFPQLEQDLTLTRKLAQENSDAGRPPGKSSPKPTSPSEPRPKDGTPQSTALERVAENQVAVLESLQDLLQDLSKWKHERDVQQELTDLTQGQSELNKQTLETGKQTLTKPRESLAPQEQADLARLAERQRKQAEKFEQFEGRLQELIQRLRPQQPDAADTLNEALQQARQQATAAQMREASAQIDRNTIGEAARSQQEVLDKLRRMDAALKNQHDSDAETLTKKLKQSEQQLDQLRLQENELLRKIQQAGEMADPQQRQQELERLKKEQRRLQEELAKLTRQLERLQVRKPQQALQRAANRTQNAQEKLGQDQAQGAADEVQEALDDLEQAQRELARARQQAEEKLAFEQLEKIGDQLRAMLSRQEAVLVETRRLEGLKQEKGSLTRAQLKSLLDLAETQRTLKQETDRLVETLTAAEIFALALKGAARQMQRAGELLAARNTGLSTQQAETAAKQRFADLVEALTPEKPGTPPAGQKPPEGAAGGAQDGPPTDGIPVLSELKLLKTLQEDLQRRTQELSESMRKNGKLTPAEQQELETLGHEQGDLADLARNFLQRATSMNTDDEEAPPPEKIPPEKKPDEKIRDEKIRDEKIRDEKLREE